MPRMVWLLPLLAYLSLTLTPPPTWSHGGGIDRFGCHHDRSAGTYHCHQGPLAGQQFASQSDMLAALQQSTSQAKPLPVLPGEFTGKVVRVLDGDTIEVMHGGRAERVRLNGIDCPEKGQPFGTKAKEFTSEMVFGKIVTVHVTDMDKYGRTVADGILPDGRVLNRELVGAGLAWWYRQYSQDATLGRLEAEARAAQQGLWADPNPIAPWCWRKRQKGREC